MVKEYMYDSDFDFFVALLKVSPIIAKQETG